MRLWLSASLERFRSSLFLVPMLSVLAAIALAVLGIEADARVAPGADDLPLGLTSTVDSARAVLSTVAGATITFAAISFSISLLIIQQASSQYSPRVVHTLFRDPFNKRRAFHSGLDFPAPSGTPIRASAGGVVVYSGFRSDYGRQVEIDHGNGLVTRYSHARRLHVKVGDVVTPGQLIADVGSSGRSTGPHLHFEVLKNGRYVDPEDFLREG